MPRERHHRGGEPQQDFRRCRREEERQTDVFNAADAYVKKAERHGGPAIAGEDGRTRARAFLIDKPEDVGACNSATTSPTRSGRTPPDQGQRGLRGPGGVVGLPEHLVSWKGKLGVAFGARGHGTASAHHEPSTSVINLTGPAAGALAHEWGHSWTTPWADSSRSASTAATIPRAITRAMIRCKRLTPRTS